MMLPHNIPARFTPQSFTINQRNVSVKLSDEILSLSCQLEQPACPMVLCSFVCGWSSCPSPLCFHSDLSSAHLCFHCADALLRSLVQEGIGTLAPGPRPNGVLFCQDVCHNAVCSELLRLRLRILEVQIDLFHAHNRCYDLFILRNLEHSGSREMRG